MSNWFQIRSDKPNRWFRSRNVNFNQWANWNTDGDLLASGGNVNGGLTLLNNWNFGGGIGAQGTGFDDRATRGGPGVYMRGYREGWGWLNSDNRRALSLNHFTGGGRTGDGASWFEVSPGSHLRPMPAFTFNPAIRYSRNIFDAQWVEQVTDSVESLRIRAPRSDDGCCHAALQLHHEPESLAAAVRAAVRLGGDYDGYKELANGRSLDYAGRYRPYAYDIAANGDPDFNVKSFRTTQRRALGIQAGFHAVRRVAAGDERTTRCLAASDSAADVTGIFGVPPKNVFLVKLAYWLNY